MRNIFAIILFFSLGSFVDSQIVVKYSLNNGLPSENVNDILKDAHGYFWFATDNGLVRYDGYNFYVYRDDGANKGVVSSNKINCLFEDSKGKIWAGTKDGLVWFDYASEKFFTHIPDFGLVTKDNFHNILSISEDGDGNFWYINGALGRLTEDGKDTLFTSKSFFHDVKNKPVKVIVNMNRDNFINGPTSVKYSSAYPNLLFISTWRNGLVIYNLKQNKIENVVKPFDNSYNSIKSFSIFGDKLIIPYYNGYLVIYDITERKIAERVLTNFTEGLNDVTFYDNQVFIGGVKGFNILSYRDLYTKDPIAPLSYCSKYDYLNLTVNKLLLDDDKNLWQATNDGVCKIISDNQGIKSLRATNKDNELRNDNITSIIENKSRLYIGTWGGGISIFDAKLNKFVSENLNLNNDLFVTKMMFSDSNNLIVGTRSNGLYVHKLNAGITQNMRFENGLSNLQDDLIDYIEDFEILGNKVIASTKGENLIFNLSNRNVIKISDYRKDFPKWISHSICNLSKDFRGNLVVQDYRHFAILNKENLDLIKEYHSKPTANAVDKEDDVSGYFIKVILDENQDLWLVKSNGLLKFDKNYNAERIISVNGLNDALFKNGSLFMATDLGLKVLCQSKNELLDYGTNDGLPDNCIFKLFQGGNNKVWCMTNNGVASYDIENHSFISLNFNDGLNTNSFERAVFCESKSGEVFIGTRKGLNTIPSDFDLIEDLHKIYFTSLFVDENEILPDSNYFGSVILDTALIYSKEIKIPYGFSSLKITFSDFDYKVNYRKAFEYRLLNFNADFVKTKKNYVEFPALKPGKYFLSVKHPGSKIINELVLYVEPAFFQTFWFYLLLIVLLITILFLFVRIRYANIEKKNAKLQQKVEERTEEIVKQKVELEKKNVQIKKQNSELDKIIRTKDQLLSIIAHDLKNSFNLINGFSTLLLKNFKNYDQSKIEDYLKIIRNSSIHTNELLENLLNWSRANVNKLSLKADKHFIDDIINDCLIFFEEAVKEKNIEIRYVNTELIVFVDRDIVMTILRNLISNAIKFSYANSEIIIKSELIHNSVKVSVKDFGVGISQEQMGKLKSKEFVSSTKGTFEEEGSGLGLAVTDEFVSLLGSKLEIDSELGVFTEFSFKINPIE